MHRDIRAHLDSLRFLVAALNFFTKLLEDALNQLDLIVHDFDKRRVSGTVPQDKILTKTGCQIESLSIAHVSNVDIVLVIDVHYMTGFEIDLLITLIVTSA